MVLSDSKIKEEIKKGNIVISDFDESRLNPNSYNLRLDKVIKIYENRVLDMKGENKATKIEIPEEGYVLQPGYVYIASTIEHTETTGSLVPVLEGRSSIGRLGIFTHVTAGWGDTGFKGRWTLEIVVTQPVKVYPEVEICQIVFHRVEGKVEHPYHGKYQNQKGAEPSKMFKDFMSKGKPVNVYSRDEHQSFRNFPIFSKPIQPILSIDMDDDLDTTVSTNETQKILSKHISESSKKEELEIGIKEAVRYALGEPVVSELLVNTIYNLLVNFDKSITYISTDRSTFVRKFIRIMKYHLNDIMLDIQTIINEAAKECAIDDSSNVYRIDKEKLQPKSAFQKIKDLTEKSFDKDISKQIYDILINWGDEEVSVQDEDVYEYTSIIYSKVKEYDNSELNKTLQPNDDDMKMSLISADALIELGNRLMSRSMRNSMMTPFSFNHIDFLNRDDKEAIYDKLYEKCNNNEYSKEVADYIVEELCKFDCMFRANVCGSRNEEAFTKIFYDKIRNMDIGDKSKINELYGLMAESLMDTLKQKNPEFFDFFNLDILDKKETDEKKDDDKKEVKEITKPTDNKSILFTRIVSNWKWDKESLDSLLQQIEVLVDYVYEEEYNSDCTEKDEVYEYIVDHFNNNDINEFFNKRKNVTDAVNTLLAIVRAEI